MPMSGKSTSEDIREFHGGKTTAALKKLANAKPISRP